MITMHDKEINISTSYMR